MTDVSPADDVLVRRAAHHLEGYVVVQSRERIQIDQIRHDEHRKISDALHFERFHTDVPTVVVLILGSDGRHSNVVERYVIPGTVVLLCCSGVEVDSV